MKRFVIASLIAASMLLIPKRAAAFTYDRDDSDYPLRYAAYVVYPVGITAEYLVLRPIHWLVSANSFTQVFFGNEVQPTDPQDQFVWE